MTPIIGTRPSYYTITAALFVALLLIVAPTAAHAAATPPPIDSSIVKTVHMDPRTGAITSVEAGAPADAPTPGPSARIGNNTNCSSGRACWYAASTPYPNQAFYGAAGAISGTWTNRGTYYSGNYTVRGCWRYDGNQACGEAPIGPNSYATLGVVVTGTSFRIY